MQRVKMKAPVRLDGVMTVLITIALTTSLKILSQTENALAQIPIPVDPITVDPIVEPLQPSLQLPEPTAPSYIREYVNPVKPRFCQRDLQTAISSIIDSPKFKAARWGILIQPVSEFTVLYRHNPDIPLIPASNVKLLTTAAALRLANDRDPQTFSSFTRWVTVINRDSDNARADALLRRIGGQKAVRNILAPLGVNSNSYKQVDGSGLSRKNRANPSTFVTLLKGMYTDSESHLFYQSLAIAGVNGTLRNRFRNTLVQGRLHGKTGTLQGVRALSGYLDNSDYGTIVFSIVVNQPGQSGQALTKAIDQIVLKTAQVARCD